MSKDVILPKLRDWQKEFFRNAKRYNVLVIHRRAGKTTGSILYLIKQALIKKGYYGYIAPTYKMAKNIAFDMLCDYAGRIPNAIINKSELKITLMNGSKIQLFGSDTPDSLRGLPLCGVIFDEYSMQASNIYSEIVSPMLIENGGWAIWIGTPKGKNDFYKLYQKASKEENYYGMLLKASSSGLLSKEQIDQAKQESDTEDIFEQEYECSFEAAIKGSYYKRELKACREEGRVKSGLYDPLLDVYTVWDIGISDYMAIGFVQIHGGQVRFIDAYQANGEGFEHYKQVFHDKGYKYAGHYFPHDIKVRELTSGQSRLETVRHMFGDDKVHVLPQLKIMDGIQAVRKLFGSFWFDEDKCGQLLECLALYRQKYDETRGIYLNTPEHDWTSHMADMTRYVAIAYERLTENKLAGEVAYQNALNEYLEL